MPSESGADPRLDLNIAAYPSPEAPDTLFPKLGLTIPETWQQRRWAPESFAVYSIPIEEADKLPEFVHEIFLKCFKCRKNYRASCTLDGI